MTRIHITRRGTLIGSALGIAGAFRRSLPPGPSARAHPAAWTIEMLPRPILGSARDEAGHPGVIGVFSGHTHVDYSRLLDGIYYTLINSASYVWVGPDPIGCGADPAEGFWGWGPPFATPRVSS